MKSRQGDALFHRNLDMKRSGTMGRTSIPITAIRASKPCVVIPEHGPKEEYYGFVSEAQALSWIQKEMHLRPNAKGADPKATWRKKPGEDD
jgi:hypothetical protein